MKIKPDLSPQERLCESLLLKEHWKLIQAGTDRQYIKIRRSSLIVSGKVHAEVVNNILQFASTPNEPSSVVMDIEDQGDKRSEGFTSQPSNTNAWLSSNSNLKILYFNVHAVFVISLRIYKQ